MTLQPALARLERGYRRMWSWCVARLQGARAYRFDGEERAQEDQLRETRVSLAMMASATDDPDQLRMATDIEDGAEKRLAVLLGKPQLALAEKRERDDIQRALQARRQSFDAPRLVQRTDGGWRPQGFAAIGAMAAFRPWMAWAGAIALLLGLVGVQTGRLANAKADLREERAETAALARDLAQTNAERDLLADAVQQAGAQNRQAAETMEAERARRLRAEREARSIRNAMEQARAGNSVDYGFGGVRDDGQATPGASGGDSAGNRTR